MNYLIVQVIGYNLPKCLHNQPIVECNCTDRLYVNTAISNISLLCHTDSTVQSVETNSFEAIPFTTSSPPCPRFVGDEPTLIQMDANGSFYCFDNAVTDGDEIFLGFSPASGFMIDECFPADNQPGQLITVYQESYSQHTYVVCQPCPPNADCQDQGVIYGCGDGYVMMDIEIEDDYMFNEQYCLPCSAIGGLNCDGTEIIDCLDAFYRMNETFCAACSDSEICLNGDKKTCASLGGLKCANNEIVQCQTGLISLKTEVKCVPCPEGAICDKMNFLGCQNEFYRAGESCTKCDSDKICDGVEMRTCYQVGGQTCLNNVVTKCLDNLVLTESMQACFRCVQGLKFDGTSCVACKENSLCRGDDTEVSCGVGNILNVKNCLAGKIQVCLENMLPSVDRMSCLDCRLFKALETDGQNITKCYSSAFKDGQLCVDCPDNNLCNGFSKLDCSDSSNELRAKSCLNDVIVACFNHFIPSEDGLSCRLCTSSDNVKDCDGFKVINCIQGFYLNQTIGVCQNCSDAFGLQCSEGKIIKCIKDYALTTIGTCSKCDPKVQVMSCQNGEFPLCTDTAQKNLGYVTFDQNNFQCHSCGIHTCNGSHVLQCSQGYELTAFGVCATCYGNVFCGGLSKIQCGDNDNSLNALECSNGFIYKCKQGFVLNRVFTECIPCSSSVGNFVLFCSGNQEVSCKIGQQMAQGQMSDQNLIQCVSCPENAECNGSQITQCPEHHFRNGFECTKSIIDVCKQGDDIRRCNCTSGAVFFRDNTLKCDAQQQMTQCQPSVMQSTKIIAEGDKLSYDQQNELKMDQMCACQTNEDTIAGLIKEDEFYCIQVRIDHGSGNKFVLRAESVAAFSVQNGNLKEIDGEGWLYSRKIFMRCDIRYIQGDIYLGTCVDSHISNCPLNSANKVAEFVMVRFYLSDSMQGTMCLPIVVQTNERLSAYYKNENPLSYTPCNFLGLLVCNQAGLVKQQCLPDHSFIGHTCQQQKLGELFNGIDITRCSPGFLLSENRLECLTKDDTFFRDGIQNISCENLNGDECSGELVKSCKDTYWSYEKVVCITCEESITGLYQPTCGTEDRMECFANDEEKPFVYQQKGRCIPCPSGELCDGVNVIRCPNDQLRRLGKCAVCPVGMACDGTAKAVVVKCLPGFFISESAFCQSCKGQHDKLCNGLTNEPLGCSVADDNIVSCKNGLVESCSLGFIPNVDYTSCSACTDEGVFCDGKIQHECLYVAQAQKCKNGLVSKCELSLKVNKEKSGCDQCAGNVYCDGIKEVSCQDENEVFAKTCQDGLIIKCIVERKLTNNSNVGQKCDQCGLQMICDGLTEYSCASANGEVCEYGKITECIVQYWKESDILCTQCLVEDEHDCGKFPTCTKNQYRELFACKSCENNFYCDGSETTVDCSAPNGLNAAECTGNEVKRCENTHYHDSQILDVSKTCRLCPAKIETIEPQCDGLTLKQCFSDLATKHQVYQKIQANEFQTLDFLCLKCPENSLCDGAKIIKCAVGQLLHNDSLGNSVCQNCPENSICDGSVAAKQCDQIQGAASCEGGIMKCSEGFEVVDGISCLQKSRSGCNSGCIAGIVVAIVVVVVVVIVGVVLSKRKPKGYDGFGLSNDLKSGLKGSIVGKEVFSHEAEVNQGPRNPRMVVV